MLSFTTKFCNSFKFKNHLCVGFLRRINLMEVYCDSKKCTFEINNDKEKYVIEDEHEVEFYEKILNCLKEIKKNEKLKEKKNEEPKKKRGRPRKQEINK